jgi:hypothetical protein
MQQKDNIKKKLRLYSVQNPFHGTYTERRKITSLLRSLHYKGGGVKPDVLFPTLYDFTTGQSALSTQGVNRKTEGPRPYAVIKVTSLKVTLLSTFGGARAVHCDTDIQQNLEIMNF